MKKNKNKNLLNALKGIDTVYCKEEFTDVEESTALNILKYLRAFFVQETGCVIKGEIIVDKVDGNVYQIASEDYLIYDLRPCFVAQCYWKMFCNHKEISIKLFKDCVIGLDMMLIREKDDADDESVKRKIFYVARLKI